MRSVLDDELELGRASPSAASVGSEAASSSDWRRRALDAERRVAELEAAHMDAASAEAGRGGLAVARASQMRVAKMEARARKSEHHAARLEKDIARLENQVAKLQRAVGDERRAKTELATEHVGLQQRLASSGEAVTEALRAQVDRLSRRVAELEGGGGGDGEIWPKTVRAAGGAAVDEDARASLAEAREEIAVLRAQVASEAATKRALVEWIDKRGGRP